MKMQIWVIRMSMPTSRWVSPSCLQMPRVPSAAVRASAYSSLWTCILEMRCSACASPCISPTSRRSSWASVAAARALSASFFTRWTAAMFISEAASPLASPAFLYRAWLSLANLSALSFSSFARAHVESVWSMKAWSLLSPSWLMSFCAASAASDALENCSLLICSWACTCNIFISPRLSPRPLYASVASLAQVSAFSGSSFHMATVSIELSSAASPALSSFALKSCSPSWATS
mmetsp:Transcript_27581/g.78025  ORF Transcript_27581/g.78025 Transcript_27581/m.78025 type:complete len:234 (-) Transcript_27581:960-1661(-)